MTINTLLHIVQYSIKPLTVLSQLLKMYLDNNSTTKSHEMWMCVVSQYFAFRQENTFGECLCLKIIWNLQTHPHFLDNFVQYMEREVSTNFLWFYTTFFHSSVQGEVGKQMAEERKLFIKVFMKLTLESMSLFLACM